MRLNEFKYQGLRIRRNIIQIPKGRYTLLFEYFLKQQEYIFYDIINNGKHFENMVYKENQRITEDGVNFKKVDGL